MVSREYKRRAYSIIRSPGHQVKSCGHCSKCVIRMNTSIINPPNNSVIQRTRESQSTITVLTIPILQVRSLKLRQAGGAHGHLQSGGWDRPQALHFSSHCLVSTWQLGVREDTVQYSPNSSFHSIPERLVS